MKKRVAIVTGGTSGLGLRIVSDLVKAEYEVFSLSRDMLKITECSSIVKEATFLQADVTDLISLAKALDKIKLKTDKVDLLVNNAGIIYAGGILSINENAWKKVLDTNLNGIFNTTQTFLELLKTSGNANIVNISSISSEVVGSSMPYSVSKAAVNMMTKCMAEELAHLGIRVNCVSPGLMKTGFQKHNGICGGVFYEEMIEKNEKSYPLGIPSVESVSNTVLFLSSDIAGSITGSNIVIDGGKLTSLL